MIIRQRGFSLMEALISVLVLSVGLLGLGQLQAALWKSAGQLYAHSEAYLLSASHLEHGLPVATTEAAAGEPLSARSGATYAVFESVVQAEQQGRLVRMEAASHWEDTSGSNTARLQTADYRSDPGDARWLLERDCCSGSE